MNSNVVSAFIDATSNASTSIREFENQLEEKHLHVKQIIDDLEDIVSPADAANESPILADVFQQLAASMKEWRKQLKEEVNGQVFSQIFDQSLIVMVYGKVNSGKSSLGNFLAGKVFSDLDLPFYKGLNPRFRVHASASSGDVIESREVDPYFAVDAKECTREIQEFTLGGLSWVDTPGIHSLRDDNQALARRYVESAELVVYLTDSSSPARESDMREMSNLLAQGKRAIVVVSKFDQAEEDFDDGELISVTVMKPEKNRHEQRGWVEEQIKSHGLDPLLHEREYYFVSTRFVEETLLAGRSADEVLEESGLAALYGKLGSILTDDAIELKKRAPRRRFNKLLDDIAGTREREDSENSLTNRLEKIKDFTAQVEQRSAHLNTLKTHITSRAINKAKPLIEARLIESHDKVNADMPDPNLADDIGNIIGDALEYALKLTLAESFHDILSTLAELDLHTGTWEVPTISVVFDEIELSTAQRNKKIGAALGATPGGVVGGILGSSFGPLGAVIGSAVGSAVTGAIGGAIGGSVSGTTKERIKTGTDFEEITAKLIGQVHEKLGEVVKENLDRLTLSYFVPLLDSLDKIARHLKRAQNELTVLRYDVTFRSN